MFRKKLNKTIRNFGHWILNQWWVILICLIILYVIIVSVINVPELNRVTTTVFNYLNQILAPSGVIIGLMLGYPLLRHKLIDGYITKQFEITHENNRIIKRECINLKEKYPDEYISKTLDQEYLASILQDVKRLNELAIDANPEVYKYSYLLYKSLQIFSKKTQGGIPENFHEQYYCETLSGFVNNHVDRIYRYSKSIGNTPRNRNIKERQILVSILNKYVTDNKYYEIDNFNDSLSFKHASALLVSFFSTNIRCLSDTNGLLFRSCYEVIPSPSPFARIMFNQNIYLPLVLTGEKLLNIFVPQLVLVGYTRQKSTKLESGISVHYLICHYSNISDFGFVAGFIKEKKTLSEYKDTYVDSETLNTDDIESFDIMGESIIIKVSEENAMKYFSQVKGILSQKMNNETGK
jgi:hypothetical protein